MIGSYRKPAVVPGFGETKLISYGDGLASRKFSTFNNIKVGIANQQATKYLWTIDKRGINIALEQTTAETGRGYITHTNISVTASAGGEVWFTGENSVYINHKSARFGNLTKAQWSSVKAAWEKIGYKVEASNYHPPTPPPKK